MAKRSSLEKQVALFTLNDKETFVRLLKFLEPSDIDNFVYSKIFELQKEHYIKESVLHDKKFLLDSIKDVLIAQEASYDDLLPLYEGNPALDSKNFILDEVLQVARRNRLLAGLHECTEKLDEPAFKQAEVQQIILKSVAINYDTDLGMSIWDYEQRISSLRRISDFAVPSFSDKLNARISGGRYPGELYVYLAPPGVGKSLFLIQDAYKVLRKDYKAVYVTFELSKERVGLRFDCLSSKMESKEIFADKQKLFDKYTMLKRVCKGDIIIKEYPTQGASVLDLNIYLDELKIYKGFEPDILFIDYGDIMKPIRERDSRYSEQGEIFVNLRKLAQERNIPVVTATQTTRDALEKHYSKIDMSKISDSFDIARIADAIYGLCQTEEDREENKIFLKILKNRNGPQNVVIPYNVDYPKMTVTESEE
jgi:replicative DNA helicase